MIKLLPAAAGALVTALMLTACATSAHHEGSPSAALCARAEAAVQKVALETAPYSGVTTSDGLAAAGKKLRALSRLIRGGQASTPSYSYLGYTVIPLKAPPFPPQLASRVRQVNDDQNAFATTFGAYYRSQAGPKAVGKAAEKTMRDIQAIRATCSRTRR